MKFDAPTLGFTGRGLTLAGLEPLLDGEVPAHAPPEIRGNAIIWHLLDGGSAVLDIGEGETLTLDLRMEGLNPARPVDSLGLRCSRIEGVHRYLRNGYTSWDGSWFVEAGTPAGDGPPGNAPTLGYALTALLPANQPGACVLGFDRHDRFQSRLRFGGTADVMTLDIETLIDRTPHGGSIAAERLHLFDRDTVEPALRRWSRIVAAASPRPPRIPERRITGWCSWYNLYASIDEPLLQHHIAAAAAFRDKYQVPLDVFQIDDGFNPEMGDWLDFKPQFPRGVAPLLAEAAAAGFTPGLWIAPFMVGNRSKLFAAHPDWVVTEVVTGAPLTQMKFYGEFRWHKRSEEYYILDITHPDAAAYIADVFRTWRNAWGCDYFKTDFMLFGSEHGPDRARWYQPGLSRIAIWQRMATLIRDSIGDALWLGCGAPIWAAVGLVDAVRIGRDAGTEWSGDRSTESLLRDQLSRNHAHGILWHADPDCLLLRDRFHDLSDTQVRSLATFAAMSGGVLMTSDSLDELSAPRAALLAELLHRQATACRFPHLGEVRDVVEQHVRFADGTRAINWFNVRSRPASAHVGPTLEPFDSKLMQT